MKLFFYNALLHIIKLFIQCDRPLSHKNYKRIYKKKLYFELKQKYEFKEFDFWFDRTWKQTILANGTGNSDTFVGSVIESTILLMKQFSLKHMCGIQPLDGPVGLAYTLNVTRNDDDNTIKLEVISNGVQAEARRLNTRYTLEAAQDLKTEHNVDVQHELTKAISQSIDAEFMNEFISEVNEKSPIKETFSMDVINANTMTYLHGQINIIASKIAMTTRRGAGNVIFTSPYIASLLEEYGHIKPNSSESNLDSLNLRHIGLLNQERIVQVYSYNGAEPEFLMIGYKGGSTEVDAGLILCPYVPIISTGVVMDQKTCDPVVTFMTRYGRQAVNDTTESWEMENNNRFIYYGVLNLTLPAAYDGDAQISLEDAA